LTYLVGFTAVSAAELVRGRILRFFEAIVAPGTARLERMHRDFRARAGEAGSTEQVVRDLIETAETATGARHVALLVRDGRGYRSIGRGGAAAPFSASLWGEAEALLAEFSVVDTELLGESIPASRLEVLERAGVAAIVGASYARRLRGILLLGPKQDGQSYTVSDLEFLNALARSAAMTLHIRHDASIGIDAARDEATTRVAVGLAHDLGKEVDWMTRLVRRLPEAAGDRAVLERDVRLATELSRNVSKGLRRFVRESTDGRREAEQVLLDDLIDDAIGRVARAHGSDRVIPTIDPALGEIRIHRDFESVVANLLDNAVHASPRGEFVRLFATLRDAGAEIVVEDRGPGIAPGLAPKLFQPGFTTRADGGGLGVGLAACRDILRDLGAAMELRNLPRGGARATVLLPTG